MSRTVLLNGAPVQLEFEAGNLTDLLENMYASGTLKGEIVRSIKFEDENLLLADRLVDQPLPDGTLEVESVPAWSIILEALSEAEELRGELKADLTSAVESIRVHGSSEASEPLKRSADLLLILVELFSSIDEFAARWPLMGLDVGFTAFRTKLAEVLRDLLEAQEVQNWVELADLIEYELIPTLSELHDQLEDSTSKIKSLHDR